MLFVFSSFGWSLVHPWFVWNERKKEWTKNLIWIVIGLIPVLYFVISMTIAMTESIE